MMHWEYCTLLLSIVIGPPGPHIPHLPEGGGTFIIWLDSWQPDKDKYVASSKPILFSNEVEEIAKTHFTASDVVEFGLQALHHESAKLGLEGWELINMGQPEESRIDEFTFMRQQRYTFKRLAEQKEGINKSHALTQQISEQVSQPHLRPSLDESNPKTHKSQDQLEYERQMAEDQEDSDYLIYLHEGGDPDNFRPGRSYDDHNPPHDDDIPF